MSYSTSSPGSETAPVPKRRVAALFAACLMLLTTAGVGVASTAGAAQPRPVQNPGAVNVNTGGSSDPWGSIKVSWTTPVPADFVTGYLVLVQEATVGQTTFDPSTAYRVVPVSGVNTNSVVVSNLGWDNTVNPPVGFKYFATVLATNGEGSEAFINDAFALGYVNNKWGVTNPPPPVPGPTGITPPPARYAFPTVDAMINAHYQEFLDRAPTFVERNLWQDIFQANGENLNCVGVDTTVTPNDPPQPVGSPAMAWGPEPLVSEGADNAGAQNCPNTGTEYRMISILRTGSPGWAGIYQPWSANFWAENPTTYQGIANPVTRLYFAYFDRVPDDAGFEYWTGRFRDGTGSLDWIANYFANSPEFQATYPTIQTNADFVSMVYFNVLHRAPDATGMAFWVAQLQNGASKGRVMNQFAQSDENIRATRVQTAIVNIWGALLDRMPTDNELVANAFWADNANSANPNPQALNVWVIQGAVRNSAEYAALQG